MQLYQSVQLAAVCLLSHYAITYFLTNLLNYNKRNFGKLFHFRTRRLFCCICSTPNSLWGGQHWKNEITDCAILTKIYHKSMNFTLISLQICTFKTLIFKIHSDSSSINIPTNSKHNRWWICRFSGFSVYPITAWKPTTEYKPNRLKLEQIGSWEGIKCVWGVSYVTFLA